VIKGKLISMLGGARLEVFSHNYSARKKIIVKKNVIDFVRKFVNFKNYKDVIMAVKVDVPKLLGY
jgi:UDP-galactopyranose mutase